MSKQGSMLLINEEPLQVLPSLAILIGLNEAILLQQIHYWLRNPKSGVVRQGRKWVFNSYEEWQEQMPFWSARTIQRIAVELETRRLVTSDTLGGRDRRKWYTINYDEVDKLLKGHTHTPLTDIPNDSQSQPVPTRQVGTLQDANLALSDATSWHDTSRQVGMMEDANLSRSSRQVGTMLNKVAEISTEISTENLYTHVVDSQAPRAAKERVCVLCGLVVSIELLERYARRQPTPLGTGWINSAWEGCNGHALVAVWLEREHKSAAQQETARAQSAPAAEIRWDFAEARDTVEAMHEAQGRAPHDVIRELRAAGAISTEVEAQLLEWADTPREVTQ